MRLYSIWMNWGRNYYFIKQHSNAKNVIFDLLGYIGEVYWEIYGQAGWSNGRILGGYYLMMATKLSGAPCDGKGMKAVDYNFIIYDNDRESYLIISIQVSNRSTIL